MTDRLIANDQGYGYGQMWKAMLLARQGKSGAARTLLAETLKAHGSDWPGMLIRWMLGKFDDEMLLRKAHEGTEQDIQNQLCEANFYLGERAFTQGDKAKAATYFAGTLDTKIYHYIEYFAASAYQRRLKSEN
jgi:lipoprotein NlpI